MKFIANVRLIMLFSFLAGIFFPWWTIAIVGFLAAMIIRLSPGLSFFAGFIANFVLWTAMAFWISTKNDHLLAHKISLIILKIDNPALLILISGLIGGLITGMGSLTGSLLAKRIWFEEELVNIR
ncbi:MAG: hypothetical protein NVS3B19_15710 [Ginsengibacter sp.]